MLIAILSIVLILVCVIVLWVRVIPPRNFAIVDRLGRYSRYLTAGPHIVFWPIDQLRHLRWTYPSQNGKLRTLSGSRMVGTNAQMDIPPIECITRDQLRVTIDGTVMYSIINVDKATNKTDDTLRIFYDTLVQCVQDHVRQTLSDQVYGHGGVLGTVICQKVNERTEDDYGVRCNGIIFQSVTMDPTIIDANQKIHAAKMQQDMLIEQQQAELQRQRVTLELERERVAAEAERRRLAWEQKPQSKFSNQELIEWRRAKHPTVVAGWPTALRKSDP
jgi:regulator of protease activity HflC (stomatin/prohibitin superfamily)